MPAKSKAQKTAMCMALAARKGDLEVSKLKGAALEIYHSDMTNKEIEEFTVMESLQNYINKNMKNLVEYINESKVNYYIWQEDGDWYGTDETNKNARIKNARAILNFQGFDTEEEVREYIAKYFSTVDSVILLDKRP
jgi:hypothetical protein